MVFLRQLGLYAALGMLGIAAACAGSNDVAETDADLASECSAEVCGDGLDNDCDGSVDEDCSCNDGEEQECYTGSPVSAALGVCRTGIQTCTASNTWGDCTGDLTPTAEICDKLDNDCDGSVDEGCTPGTLLANGNRCAADGDCLSGNCECEDFECELHFCVEDDCLCGYGTSGSCDEPLTGQQDPEDCEGADVSCGAIDDCVTP